MQTMLFEKNGIQLEVNNEKVNKIFQLNSSKINKIIMKITKYFGSKDNEHDIFQNLWSAGKATIREKCTALKHT